MSKVFFLSFFFTKTRELFPGIKCNKSDFLEVSKVRRFLVLTLLYFIFCTLLDCSCDLFYNLFYNFRTIKLPNL